MKLKKIKSFLYRCGTLAFLLGFTVRAAAAHINVPAGTADLRATATVLKKIMANYEPRNYRSIVGGFASVRERCDRANRIQFRLSKNLVYLDQSSTVLKPGQLSVHYVSPRRLRQIYQDRVAVVALRKSISRKIHWLFDVRVAPILPSQTLVNWLFTLDVTPLPAKSPLKQFLAIHFHDRQHLVANAQDYFKQLLTNVDSTSPNFSSCVQSLDNIGLGPK